MATNEIKTRLTLEGVDEVKRSLESLGRAGEEAFSKIGKAADKAVPGLGGKLDLAVGNFKTALGNLGTASSAVSKNFAAVRVSALRLGRELGTVAARIGVVTAAITGTVVALGKFTQIATENADQVGKAAQGLGLTTKAYQELQFAAEQSGVSTEEFGKGFTRLNVVIGDALSGNAAAIKKFSDLGIALRDARGNARPAEDIFKDLAQAISQFPDGAQRAAIASDFFGKSVSKWLPLILEGKDGIQALQDQFAKSGLGFTDNEIRNATEFNDALSALLKLLRQLRDKIFIQLAVPFRRAFDAISAVVVANSGKILSATQQIVDRFVPIFEDAFNALLGNDDLVKAQWVIELRDNIISFGDAVQTVVFGVVLPAFQALATTADALASAFNLVFGTEINGQVILLTAALLNLTGVFSLLAPALSLVVSFGRLLFSVFGLIGPAITAVSALFPVIITGAQAVFAALSGLAGWPLLIIAAVAAAAIAIYAFWDEIVLYSQQAYDAIAAGAVAAWQTVANAAVSAWQQVLPVLVGANNAFVAAAEALRGRVITIWQSLTASMTALWNATTRAMISALDVVIARIRSAISAITSAITKVQRLISSSQKSTSGGGSGYASGGYIRGPGSGTSDSIPAWLSNGEFVIRASAVRKYGAELFAALNGMKIKPNLIGKFALGGLVTMPAMPMAALPASASGPTSAVTLVLDGQQFSGLTGPSDTLERLEKAIKTRRIRSTGRASPYATR